MQSSSLASLSDTYFSAYKGIMGVMYRMESLSLIENVEPEEFESIQEFIDKTKENYKHVSNNCFIAVGIYILILLSTILCILKARRNARQKEAELQDDDLSCAFEEVELTEKQKKKIK